MMRTFNSNVIKYILAVLFFASFSVVKAQNEPIYTQYMYNIGSFNPAYSATVEDSELIALYRYQWAGIDDAPQTARLGGNFPFASGNNGLGFNIIYDVVGPASQGNFALAYAHQVYISATTRLSFGLEAGGSFLNIDLSKGSFRNESDLLINGNQTNNFYPTIGTGVFLYDDYWYLGLSIPNFFNGEFFNEEVKTLVADEFQYNFIGGYVFGLSESVLFKPAFLVNFSSGAPANLNLSANFLINDGFTAGASYRFDNAFSGLVGFQASRDLFIGYSYDYNINNLSEYNSGSHELIFKYYFKEGGNQNRGKQRIKNKKQKGKPKQIDSPRFF